MRRVDLLILPLLIACGDPLRGGEALDELFGLRPAPQDPAWEMRWLGHDELVIGCDLQPTTLVGDSEIQFGEVVVTAPDEPLASVWRFEGEESDWALGFPVLVDASRYDGTIVDDDPEASLSVQRGVWGVPWNIALLYASGDGAKLGETLFVGGQEIEDPITWVEVLTEAAVVTGDVEGALVPIEPVEELWVFGGEIDTENPTFALWSGAALGGVVAEDCDE